MSLLKHFLAAKGIVKEDDQHIAATPQNAASNQFSLLKNIHGSELTTGDVTNHLQAVDAADDAVDTVAFGLETTDGEIVKVYVNAEEAEAFEQKMSQLLGKVDDIDQALEELSDEFDIVHVVKPGEEDAQEIGSIPGEEDSTEAGIENQLDEPLTDDDIVQDMDDEDLIADEDGKKKDDKKDKKDDESEDDTEETDGEDKPEDGEDTADGLSFDDEADSEGEDKPEDGEDEADTEDKSEDDVEEDPEDDETDPDKKDKKKDKKKPKKEDDKMKQEGKSLLQQLVSLNEAKQHKAQAVKKEPKKEVKKEEPKEDDVKTDDVFHVALSGEEAELSKIFSTPVQQLIFRTVLLLGVSADQIGIRKFKVRKSVKDIATMIQNHPQIKNILNKLGKELAAKKGQIHKIAEAKEEDDKDGKDEKVVGAIKDQLSTEISKKIYDLIIALGVPEFLLTYKKTDFRNRIKNLSKIAIKQTRIKTYIYMLNDLLKAERKGSLKEGYEQVVAKEAEVAKVEEFKSTGLLEDFSKTDKFADLGTFSVVSMGEVGGTTIKVKDFSLEFSDADFTKFSTLLSKGKSGVVKSENKGKINLVSLASGKEFVVKYVKPSANDKYPFGVLISAKSVKKILG